MKFAIMIEGQEDVSWPDWLALARAVEQHGYEGLLRSDHYLSVMGGRRRGALDAWGTINALAAVTERIRLGTLVSPVTFRAPAVLAKLALSADHVSGGRIDVGMGTGWHQPEHDAFDLELPASMGERMDQLEAQVEAVVRFWTTTPPPPVQQPHPRIVLGGQAKRRAATLAARHAAEYNLLNCTPDDVRERKARLDTACEAAGRDPATLTLSCMVPVIVGADEAELHRRAREVMALFGADGDPAAYLASADRDTWAVGTPEQVTERLRAYADAGVERLVDQHFLHRDLDALALLAREVLPALADG